MKKILVPTDFSKVADNALDYAIGLAKQLKARILLLNVWEVIYPASEMPESAVLIAEKIGAAEYNSLHQLKERAEKVRNNGLKVDIFSRGGTFVNVTLDEAKAGKVDMIVMGTEGASGLKRFFIGSNTGKIIEKAHCPVIAVPLEARFRGLHKIVYATDYLNTDIQALKKVAELASIFNSEILLLHIEEKGYSTEGARSLLEVFTEKVREESDYSQISSKLIKAENVEEKLDEYVDKRHADLFVMSTLQHSMFDRLFGKSMTKRMSYHSKMPLMAFHHTEHAAIFI